MRWSLAGGPSRPPYRAGQLRSGAAGLLCVLILSTAGTLAQVPDGCPSGFTGSDRLKPKTRTKASGTAYTFLNHGSSITAAKWFEQTCQWDAQLAPKRPWKKSDYKTKVVDGVETIRVKLRGYLMSVKKDPGDNDFHVEIGDGPGWNSRHLIAEFPSLQSACDARSTLIGLVQKDIDKYHVTFNGGKHAFHKAVCVEVEGFVFLDLHHARQDEADCESDGGRGLHVPTPGAKSRVVGLYEIHPAFSVKGLPASACSGA